MTNDESLGGEFKLINVQLAEDLRESLNILKKRYKSQSMAEALRKFLSEHDSDLLQKAQQIATTRKQLAGLMEEAEDNAK